MQVYGTGMGRGFFREPPPYFYYNALVGRWRKRENISKSILR